MEHFEIKDGKGQHIFQGYESVTETLNFIGSWFDELTEEAKHIQLIHFEYEDSGEIQATVFWGYDVTQGLTKKEARNVL